VPGNQHPYRDHQQHGRKTAHYTLTEDKTILQASGRCFAGNSCQTPNKTLSAVIMTEKIPDKTLNTFAKTGDEVGRLHPV